VTDEEKRAYEYVTLMWDDYHAMTYGRFDICDPEGNMDYIKAAEFTRQREEEIRQREKDRGVLNSIILRTPTGEELESLTNIDMREHSALAELKRGLRTEESQ
jgi:hypothetical protein